MDILYYDEEANFTKEEYQFFLNRINRMAKDNLNEASGSPLYPDNLKQVKAEANCSSQGQATDPYDSKTAEPTLENRRPIRFELQIQRQALRNRLVLIEETLKLLPEDIDSQIKLRSNLRNLGFYL